MTVGAKPTTAVTYYQQTGRKTGYLEQYNFNVQKQLSATARWWKWAGSAPWLSRPASAESRRRDRKPGTDGLCWVRATPRSCGRSRSSATCACWPTTSAVRSTTASIYTWRSALRKGLTIQGNYTFSKIRRQCSGRNELGDPGGALTYYNTYLNMNNRAQDWGLSGNDVKHRFVAEAIYEIPYGKGKAHAAGNALPGCGGGRMV